MGNSGTHTILRLSNTMKLKIKKTWLFEIHTVESMAHVLDTYNNLEVKQIFRVSQHFCPYDPHNRRIPTRSNQESEIKKFEDMFGKISFCREAFDLCWLVVAIDE